jgi:hypothetical protein
LQKTKKQSHKMIFTRCSSFITKTSLLSSSTQNVKVRISSTRFARHIEMNENFKVDRRVFVSPSHIFTHFFRSLTGFELLLFTQCEPPKSIQGKNLQ